MEIAHILAEERLPEINKKVTQVHPQKTFYSQYGKRLLDILFSSIALIATLPLNAIFSVITYFDVGKPIFFKQTRIGKDCKEFKIVKLRNMTNEKDKNGELLPPYQRVTKFGRFMRKTSLDELLNFWSIFKGDMSLIGPRPLLIEYLERYNARHIQRHAVRPGLECPMWKKLDRAVTWQDQFENDVWYVENVSFKVDLILIFKLAMLAVDSKSTATREKAERGIFMGYSKEGIAITMDEVEQIYFDQVEGAGL